MTIGVQNIISGILVDNNSSQVIREVWTLNPYGELYKANLTVTQYDFGPVAVFWLSAVLLSFVLPVLNWNRFMKR